MAIYNGGLNITTTASNATVTNAGTTNYLVGSNTSASGTATLYVPNRSDVFFR